LSASLLVQTTAIPANDFDVTFEAYPDLDHVCFEITVTNNKDSDLSLPFKFLLNRTSVDIARAEAKLWEEEEYEYEVTHCNTCEVEFRNCTISNETKEEKCYPYKADVTDCEVCGTWSETRHKKRWLEKQLTSTERVITSEEKTAEKEYALNELRNQFEEVQLNKDDIKRFKLCYYFNEIPKDPSTGYPGSYGYMYLEMGGRLYFDFSSSSWWDGNWTYRQPINISVSSGTTNENYPVKIVINSSNNGAHWNWSNECIDSKSTKARFLNGSNNTELDFWIEGCSVSGENMTVWVKVDQNITASGYVIYMYYNNENATAKSNGSATFNEFDGSPYEVGGQWTLSAIRSGGSLTQDGTYYYTPDYSGRWAITNYASGFYMDTNMFEDNGKSVIFYFRKSTTTKNAEFALKDDDGDYNSNHIVMWLLASTSTDLAAAYSGSWNVIPSTTYSADTWYKIEFNDINFTNHSYDIWMDDVLKSDDTPFWKDLENVTQVLLTCGTNNDHTVYIDNVIIREYHDPEPAYAVGSEEPYPISNATELEGRNAIKDGIQDPDALGPDAVIYPDQHIYIRYADGNQTNGTFDRVAVEGNQTWAFNYIPPTGNINPKTNMNNMTTVVYIWEEANLTYDEIRDAVKGLINSTNV